MKIAVCCNDNNDGSMISSRLGRSPWLGVYDDQSESWSFIENTQNLNAAQGAGIQTAQNIVNTGAEVLLTNNSGPKAMQVLQMAEIKVYQAPTDKTITDCIELYKADSLNPISSANVEGHWI